MINASADMRPEPSLLELIERARRDRREMAIEMIEVTRERKEKRAQEIASLRDDARAVSLPFEQFILDHTHEIEPEDWAKLWAACGVLHQLVARNRKR